MSAPPTRRDDVVDLLHGVPIADPYRWLENGDSAETLGWTEAQAAHTRERLDRPAWREALRQRLSAFFAIGTVGPPTVRGDRHFHVRRQGGEEQPRLFVREGASGVDRLLIDPAERGADGTCALDWFYPSDDGRLLAYGLSEGGTEKSVLFLCDVETGEDSSLRIPGTRACSLAWQPDGLGFYYTRYPAQGTVPAGQESYHRRVFHHVLGQDPVEDAPVFGDGREMEDWPNVQSSPDGRWLVVTVSRGWTRTDVYLRDLTGGGGFVTVMEGVEALFAVIVRDDRLYLHTNLEAPRYRLLQANPHDPRPTSWREIIPEGEDVLEGVHASRRHLLAAWLRDASSRLTVHDAMGRFERELPLPVICSVAGLTGAWNDDHAYYGFSSYAVPPAVARVDLRAGDAAPWSVVAAPFDETRFRVRLTHCLSRDGTRLSLFLVDRHDRSDDGKGPAVLTGYGGFNVSHTPAFGRSVIAFLEEGGLYAVAHLRGGGEYGEDWHRQGMLGRKQNVFDDFTAAALHLKAEGHVASDRLAILGGSNGGLLVGAALTQRPEIFRAVVCQVPLLDMVRYHRFRIARLWIPEYGSADDPLAFTWLLAYSPYHHVTEDVAYPAVLLTTGESDSRVDPLHARKMAARLQAATSSSRPVLLRVESRAGHGQGKPISQVLEEWTDVWTFVFLELGVAVTEG